MAPAPDRGPWRRDAGQQYRLRVSSVMADRAMEICNGVVASPALVPYHLRLALPVGFLRGLELLPRRP